MGKRVITFSAAWGGWTTDVARGRDEGEARAGGIAAVVAIPVRNEAERVGACLAALDAQAGPDHVRFGAVLLLNNCTDATAEVVAALRPRLSYPVRVVQRDSPQANAGWARRAAMEEAASWLEAEGARDGIVLTTDADSRVPPNWLACNLAALAAGADAVAGQVALEPADRAALPARLRRRGRLEARYEALLTRLETVLDPDPHDPWPKHWTTMGASLAVTLAAYRAVDGMPPLALGEDRAFVARLRAAGLVIRHEPATTVFISGRLEGRAAGGVADTMKARRDRPESPCDELLAPAFAAARRFGWHRRLRRLHADGGLRDRSRWVDQLQLTPEQADHALGLERGYAVVGYVDEVSPRLRTRLISPRELRLQIWLARLVLAWRSLGRRQRERRTASLPPS